MQKLQDSRRFQMQKSKLVVLFLVPFCLGLPSRLFPKSFWHDLTQIRRMRNMHVTQLMRNFNLYCVGDNQKGPAAVCKDPHVVYKLHQFIPNKLFTVPRSAWNNSANGGDVNKFDKWRLFTLTLSIYLIHKIMSWNVQQIIFPRKQHYGLVFFQKVIPVATDCR